MLTDEERVAARKLCAQAPDFIETENVGRPYMADYEPTAESKAFYNAARSLLPAALGDLALMHGRVLGLGQVIEMRGETIASLETENGRLTEELRVSQGELAKLVVGPNEYISPTYLADVAAQARLATTVIAERDEALVEVARLRSVLVSVRDFLQGVARRPELGRGAQDLVDEARAIDLVLDEPTKEPDGEGGHGDDQ